MVEISGTWRIARAAIFGTSALVLGLGAHVAAGGTVPGPATVVVALVVCSCVAYTLAGRPRTALSIVPVLGVLEAALHTAFMAATAQSCRPTRGAALAMVGMATPHDHATVFCAPMPMRQDSVSMLAAHVVATLATAALLARGERTARALWALVVRRRPAILVAQRAHPTVLASRTGERPAISLLAHVELARRGPPVRRCAA